MNIDNDTPTVLLTHAEASVTMEFNVTVLKSFPCEFPAVSLRTRRVIMGIT